MMRLLLRSLDAGLMVVCALLALQLGRNLHDVLWAQPAREAAPRTGDAPSQAASHADTPEPDAATPWSERAAILDRNLFHDPFEGPRSVATPAPVEVVEATELPLGLLGTIASTDSDIGAAAVWNAKRERRVVVGEGDELADGRAVVVGIERRRLLLSEDGVVRELVLDENEEIRPPKRPVRRRGRFGRRRAARR